jgi:CubicO group peptidase (beta-lactamase class C family)
MATAGRFGPIGWSLVVGALALAPVLAQSPPATAPTDAEIGKILAERIDTQRQSIGIVVGVIDPAGRRVVAHGQLARGDARRLDGDTIFEIGSITKVFTSLLLADAVERKEVALDDPVAKYLPASARMPERNGRQITLRDLASHVSGLPRLPGNLRPKDSTNPYADYTVDQLYEFLGGYTLSRDIGQQYEYSNLGAGVLGHVLARRAGVDYETLVRTRITEPLRMASTTVTLSAAMKTRLATGHAGPSLEPVPNWDLPVLAGAGALRSTTNDLLTFLAAAMGEVESPLAPAFALTLSQRKPTTGPAMDIALGWHIWKANGREIAWHNGGTGGYRTFIGFDPKSRIGIVALSNASTAVGTDDIGRHLLNRESPLVVQTPPKPRTEIAIDPKLLDGYVGRYQFAPAVILSVTRDANRLFVQLTGQPAFEVFAETTRDFFLKAVDAQITFETDAQGKATAVVLHQMGRDQRATRID